MLTLTWLMLSTQAWGQNLPAVGDGEHLWLLRPEADQRSFAISHYSQTAPVQGLRELQSLTGQFVPQGITAGHGQLWIVYANLSVQSIRPITDLTGQPALANRTQPNLPAGVILRSLASGRIGTFALVRVTTPQALAQIDTSVSSPASSGGGGGREGATPPGSSAVPSPASPGGGGGREGATPPGTPGVPGTPSNIPASKPQDGKTEPLNTNPGGAETKPAALPVDRLLMLQRNHWSNIPLPEDWVTPSAGAWLLASQDDSSNQLYLIASAYPTATAPTLRIYQGSPPTSNQAPATAPQAMPWTPYDYPLPTPSTAPILVDGQIVVAHLSPHAEKLDLNLTVLRPEGLSNLGQLTLDKVPADQPWTLATLGRTIALIARPATGPIAVARMDLQGKTITNDHPLTPSPRNPLDSHVDYVVLMAVLVIASLLLFAFWRREPASNNPALPSDLEPADLAIRLFAGLIDLAPCLLVVLVAFSLSPTQLLMAWPGRSGSLVGLIPGTVVIVLYILHCTITEIFTGKSLGKIILGLRTVNLQGQPAKPWQIIVRNLAKALDLIPPFALLILPALSTSRQRVGDLIAKTLVVAPAKPKQPESHDQDEE